MADAGLMLGFALILVTGLVISSWFALPLENYAAWRNIHVVASIATLLIAVVKIGLHGRWIIKTARRFFFHRACRHQPPYAAHPGVCQDGPAELFDADGCSQYNGGYRDQPRAG